MKGNGLEIIKDLDTLVHVGFSDAQARAILQSRSRGLATRDDVELAKVELQKENKNLEGKIKELDAKTETTKIELKHDFFAKMVYCSLGIVSMLRVFNAFCKS